MKCVLVKRIHSMKPRFIVIQLFSKDFISMADDSSSRDETLAQFAAVTGLNGSQAQFFLESSDWDLQTAISTFFESQSAAEQSAAGSAPIQEHSTAPFPSQANNLPKSSTGKNASGFSSSNSRVKTFQEMLASTSDKEDDQEERENYFAGGEKSGVMMQGGPKEKKGDALNLVKNILTKAAKSGPSSEELEKETKPLFFGGSGRRLGSEEDVDTGPLQPVEQVTDPSTQRVERHLTFWRNGFSIDDGPLREYDDPVNQEFLKAINSGRAPTSMLNVAYGQPVEVKVAHCMQQDYQPPPKQPMAAFSGSGNRLGGIVAGGPSSSQNASVQVSIPGPLVTIDADMPTTSIQIRLGDGTRMVAKFNHTHTVQDICSFVRASRPGGAAQAFVLQTTIPVRQLTDLSQTIKDAGLLNAVVVQKYV
ncbi:protein phosphatase regulator [Batrachochytrium dendrobatidis]|nr:protein phosphatase regulator [Batrachochytrium dendrobatidis]